MGSRKDEETQLREDRLASVGTLAAVVAHEINNPLSWISANLGFLKEELALVKAQLGAGYPALEAAIAESREGVARIQKIVRELQIPGAQPSPTQPAVSPASATKEGGRRGRILVIDDEALIGSCVQRILASEHDVVSTTDPFAALARLKVDAAWDVILCDLVMPQKTGMEVREEIAVTRPELLEKIVFISGGAHSLGAREFLAQIPNSYIEKPFDPERLRDVVRERVCASTLR